MGASRTQAEGTPGRAHWDAAYKGLTASGVSWYQPHATLSIEIVETLRLPLQTPVIDVGGGASIFADSLVAMGYSDVTVLDLSTEALNLAKQRLGPEASVQWIAADLLEWVPARAYGLWHDRAVFHFLTDEKQRAAYLEKLGSTISRPGYAVLATFAPDGPERCSGLPVARYGVDDLTELLRSAELEVVGGCGEEHLTPAGVVQPFTWVIARAS